MKNDFKNALGEKRHSKGRAIREDNINMRTPLPISVEKLITD